jgi:hypothetical protein
MQNSNHWKKTRMRYCILKSLVSGPKSAFQIAFRIRNYPEFQPISNTFLHLGEIELETNENIKELKNENKIKERSIYNTETKERRIEWYFNDDWLSKSLLFKSERNRVRELREKEAAKKILQERLRKETEERLKKEQLMKTEREKQIKRRQDPVSEIKKGEVNRYTEGSNSDDVFKNILALVAIIGGFYVLGKIGDALFKAFTFPVFFITCVVAFAIYYLTKSNPK